MPKIPVVIKCTQFSFYQFIEPKLQSNIVQFIRQNQVSSALSIHQPTHTILFVPFVENDSMQNKVDQFYDKYERFQQTCKMSIIMVPVDKNQNWCLPTRNHKQFVQKQPKMIQQVMQFKLESDLPMFIQQIEQEAKQTLSQKQLKFTENKTSQNIEQFIEFKLNYIIYSSYFKDQTYDIIIKQTIQLLDKIQQQNVTQCKYTCPAIFNCQNFNQLQGTYYQFVFDNNQNESVFDIAKNNLQQNDSFFESLQISQFYKKIDTHTLSLIDLLLFLLQLQFCSESISEVIVLQIYKVVSHMLNGNMNERYKFQFEFLSYILTMQDKLSQKFKLYIISELMFSYICRQKLVDKSHIQKILDKVQVQKMDIQSILVSYNYIFEEYTKNDKLLFIYNYQEVRTFGDLDTFKQKVNNYLFQITQIANQGVQIPLNIIYQILMYQKSQILQHSCEFIKIVTEIITGQNQMLQDMQITLLNSVAEQKCSHCKKLFQYRIYETLFILNPTVDNYQMLIQENDYLFESTNNLLLQNSLLSIKNLELNKAKQYFYNYIINLVIADKEQTLSFDFINTQNFPFEFINILIILLPENTTQTITQKIETGHNQIIFSPDYTIQTKSQYFIIQSISITANKKTSFLLYQNTHFITEEILQQLPNNSLSSQNLISTLNQSYILQIPSTQQFKCKLINHNNLSLFMHTFQHVYIEISQVKDINQQIKIQGSEGLQITDKIDIFSDQTFTTLITTNNEHDFFNSKLEKFYLKIPVYCRLLQSKLTFLIQTNQKQHIFTEQLNFTQLLKVHLKISKSRFAVQFYNLDKFFTGKVSFKLSELNLIEKQLDFKPRQINCLSLPIAQPVSPLNFDFTIKSENFTFQILSPIENRTLVEVIKPVRQVRINQQFQVEYKLYASNKSDQVFRLNFKDFYLRGAEEIQVQKGESVDVEVSFRPKRNGKLVFPMFQSVEVEEINGCTVVGESQQLVDVGGAIVEFEQSEK